MSHKATCDLRGELLYLYSMKLIDVYSQKAVQAEQHRGLFILSRGTKDFQLKQAQFSVGNHEEIAATTGRI